MRTLDWKALAERARRRWAALQDWMRERWQVLMRPLRRPHAPPPLLADAQPRAAPRAAVPPRSVSVVIPALNEAERIGSVVRHALADEATAEVVVIDDSSIDDTAALARAAGARVVLSSMLGKGASMHDGIAAAQKDWIVYLDGDLAGLQPGIVSDLARPLADGSADFVKGRFGRSGGRVTELTARPMLQVFFPELARFAQPLGGLIAARRTLLAQLHFEDGYGVDVGLLIDAHRAGARLAEVDIGRVENDSQSLADLAFMANEVSRVIYTRARAAGRLHVDQITTMFELQRHAAASLDAVMARRRGRTRLLLLCMDGVLATEPFHRQLARSVGLERDLAALGDTPTPEALAGLFRFVHRQQFERAAQALPLRPGAIEAVNRLRRAGFMVGVLAEQWVGAGETVRRRVFADFAIGHTLQFEGEVCSGLVHPNPAYAAEGRPGDAVRSPCRSHLVRQLRQSGDAPAFETLWAVGASADDGPLLAAADCAFVIGDAGPHLQALAHRNGAVPIHSFAELAAQLATADAAP